MFKFSFKSIQHIRETNNFLKLNHLILVKKKKNTKIGPIPCWIKPKFFISLLLLLNPTKYVSEPPLPAKIRVLIKKERKEQRLSSITGFARHRALA